MRNKWYESELIRFSYLQYKMEDGNFKVRCTYSPGNGAKPAYVLFTELPPDLQVFFSRVLASKLLKIIMCDNNAINTLRPEQYDLATVYQLAHSIQQLAKKEERLEFTDEVLGIIGAGDESELQAVVNNFANLQPMENILGNYFENIM